MATKRKQGTLTTVGKKVKKAAKTVVKAADDYVVESTGVSHRREAALEGGGGHSTSWSNTGWDAGASSSSATLTCHATST